jgi:hypothetical protein
MKRRAVRVAALAVAAFACTPRSTGVGVSPAPRPPLEWEAAIRFNLVAGYVGDSLRVEFWDGVRQRTVTRSDMRDMGAGVRTPWYRIVNGGEMTTTLAVTLRHAAGATTTVAYPITIRRDGFYEVGIMTATADQMYWARGFTSGLRAYPLNPAAHAPAGDSLWIYFAARGRRCFDCPS